MITKKNYFDHIKRIGFENLPEEIKKAHLVIMTKTSHGKDWSIYDREKEMKNMIELVFKKLGEFISHRGSKGMKGLDGIPKKKNHYPAETHFFRDMLRMKGQLIKKAKLLEFIEELQEKILSKRIRKNSPFAKDITYLQKRLLSIYNTMKLDVVLIQLKGDTEKRLKKAISKASEYDKSIFPAPLPEKLNSIDLRGIDYPATEKKLMCSTDFADMKFDSIGFEGKWLALIGDPCRGFTAMIFGKPKLGKSYLAIDMAGYLARNHGKVLYVAREEKLDATLQKKLNDKNVAHVNLFVSDHLPKDLSEYDFIFLDSVNKLGLFPKDLERLKANNPGKCFIYVFQTTKMGVFRGRNEFQHDVDAVIEVPEKGKAVQFGRFNQGGEINIFDENVSKEEISEKESELNGTLDGKKNPEKEIEIETEFPIPLEELAMEIIPKEEDLTGINEILHKHPDKANEAVTKMLNDLIKEEKWEVKVKDVKFDYNDSDNLTHGASYFKVKLQGTEKALRKIAGPDKIFIYEWQENES